LQFRIVGDLLTAKIGRRAMLTYRLVGRVGLPVSK
jgi:hypothetical protein